MECRIKFKGKEFHDKKFFESIDKALAFIDRNFDKIDSVNSQPIMVYSLKGLRPMTNEEIRELLMGRDPFARTFYSDLLSLGNEKREGKK